jgi:HD-like signal output (HDOD) protein
MHDIGKLVIARYLDNDDLARIARAQAAGATRMQAEKDVLGVDHAQLGGVIAQSWNLPHVLVDGIAHHHAPERADTPVAYGVHLADVIAKAAGFGPDDNAELETFARAMGELGLTADAYDEACDLVAARFAEVDARFS